MENTRSTRQSSVDAEYTPTVVQRFNQIESYGYEVILNVTTTSDVNLCVTDSIYEVGAVDNAKGEISLYDPIDGYEYAGVLQLERKPGVTSTDSVVFKQVGNKPMEVFDIGLIETQRTKKLDRVFAEIIDYSCPDDTNSCEKRAQVVEAITEYHRDGYEGEQTLAVDAELLDDVSVGFALSGESYAAVDLLDSCDHATREHDKPLSPLAIRELLLHYYLDTVR